MPLQTLGGQQVARSLIAVTTRQLMEATGKSDLFRPLAQILHRKLGAGGSQFLLKALTIGGGALGPLSPFKRLLTPIFGRIGGFDAETAADIVTDVLAAVGEGIPEGMSEGLDEAEVERRTREKFTALTGEGGPLHEKLAKLAYDSKKVKVYRATVHREGEQRRYELHAMDCPECIPRRQQRQGRNQPATSAYGLGIVAIDEVEVGKNLNHPPTQNPCCGTKIKRIVEDAKRVYMTLDELIAKVGDPMMTRRYMDAILRLERAAQHYSKAKRLLEELQDIRIANVWTESDKSVVDMWMAQRETTGLDGRFDMKGFISDLQTKVKKIPSIPDQAKEAVEAASSVFGEVQAVAARASAKLDKRIEAAQIAERNRILLKRRRRNHG